MPVPTGSDFPHKGRNLLVGRLVVEDVDARLEGLLLGGVRGFSIGDNDNSSGEDELLPLLGGCPDHDTLLKSVRVLLTSHRRAEDTKTVLLVEERLHVL